MENIIEQISHEIKSKRERLGLSQYDLGQRMGLGSSSQSYIAKVESGKYNLTLAQLDKIARALGPARVKFKLR